MGFDEDLIDQFRANRGTILTGPFTGRDLLLLTTRGAKSGQLRTHPLAYTRDGDRYLVIASNSGLETHPAWYHNVLADPEVEVAVGPERFRARAIPVTDGPERRQLYDQHATINPGFKEYEVKTRRVIPAVLLERVPA